MYELSRDRARVYVVCVLKRKSTLYMISRAEHGCMCSHETEHTLGALKRKSTGVYDFRSRARVMSSLDIFTHLSVRKVTAGDII